MRLRQPPKSKANPPNPMRADPTRTGGLRRRFESDLRLRVGRVMSAIWREIAVDDAFGLRPMTYNAFCPTGEGGGVDPTCKPGGKTGIKERRIADLHASADAIHHTTSEVVSQGGDILKQNAWGKDGHYGGHSLGFTTTAGGDYVVSISPTVPLRAGVPAHELVFQDAHGSTEVTGAGGAVEVFRKVSAATLAYVKKYEPAVMMYTASEDSRIKLYDRLTSTLGAAAPDYVAMAAEKGATGGRRYLLMKKGLEGLAQEYINQFSPRGTVVEKLSTNADNDDDWVFVDLPPFDPDWLGDDEPTANAQNWRFATSDRKVEEFRTWLAVLFNQELTGADDESLWTRYVTEAFRKGAARSFDDFVRTQMTPPKTDKAQRERDFLTTAFRQPVAVEKVKLLAGRVLSDLKGVTEATGVQMTRVLTDGLAQGKSPRQVAVELTAVVEGLTKARALTIARTETIRAHAEGQILALKQLGVKELGVEMEWDTAGDGKVCSLCKPMDGMVVPVDKASGMLPRHPNCRCAWKPHVPAPDGFERVNGKLVPVTNAALHVPAWSSVYVEAVLNKAGGCGIGAGGFQKGNSCAVGGGVTKAKSPGGKGNKATVTAPKKKKKKLESLTVSPAARKAAVEVATARVAAAPVPLKKRVKFNRVRLNRFARAVKKWNKNPVGNKPKQREFLDLRGNTTQRERRREKLFEEFGGGEKGYVVCHGTGLKMHHTADRKKNPKKYPVFEEGKIFTAYQGGKYDMANLLPESAAFNLGRGNKPVRPENLS